LPGELALRQLAPVQGRARGERQPPTYRRNRHASTRTMNEDHPSEPPSGPPPSPTSASHPLPPLAYVHADHGSRTSAQTLPLDLRRQGKLRCISVPSVTESARKGAALSCRFECIECACCATAVDVSGPSGDSCGGCFCAAQCEDHSSSQGGLSSRRAAFVLANEEGRERPDGAVVRRTSGLILPFTTAAASRRCHTRRCSVVLVGASRRSHP